MVCLSVRQPWAWFILHAGKDFENRDWPPRYAERQREICPKGSYFLLHASKSMTKREYEEACEFARSIGVTMIPRRDQLLFGGIVGIVRNGGMFRKAASPWFQGPIGIRMEDAYPLPFRPMPGQLGFFKAGELR